MWRPRLPYVAARLVRPVRPLHACTAQAARTPRSGTLRARQALLSQEIAQLEKELQFVEKQEEVARLTADLPPLDDATLEAMYREMIEPPPAEEAPKSLPDATPKALTRLAMRLGVGKGENEAEEAADAASIEAVERDAHENAPVEESTASQPLDTALRPASDERTAQRTLLLERLATWVMENPSEPDDLLPAVPTEEWQALAVDSARDTNLAQTLHTLDLMAQSGLEPSAALYARLLDTYATRGALDACLVLSARMQEVGLVADAPVKHAMVKAYVHSDRLFSALEYLQHWETTEAAPISAYTMLMEHLVKHPMRAVHPIAWSLFYHMRLVAHPVPDAAVYALMIRACAAGVPQPGTRARVPEADAERALDLFREMTTHYAIRPNKEVYDSLILTCARREEHYTDAIRLVRELLDGEPDRVLAPGARSALWADTYTFNALLQGSARAGDLRTARWVLAEMLRVAFALDGAPEHCRVNEETMSNIFWTYAVYEPPLKEKDIRVVDGEKDKGKGKDNEGEKVDAKGEASDEVETRVETNDQPENQPESQADDPTSLDTHSETSLEASPHPTVFTHDMPQTAKDVLVEVRALMARILADQDPSPDAGLEHPLSSVRTTPRLLNAFLSVLMHHLPREHQLAAVVHAAEDPDGVFQQAHVAPNGHTYALLLEACAAQRHRPHADAVAARVWAQWTELATAHPMSSAHGTDAKTTSKAWALMIRNKAKSYDIDAALELVRSFYALYPPKAPTTAVTSVAPAPPVDLMPVPPPSSALDALASLAPSAGSRQYPSLGPARPTLRFRDLDLLHHRCVALRRADGIRLITHVDRAFRSTRYPS